MKNTNKFIESYYQKLIAPPEVTREVLEKTFRKALRLGVWKKLEPLKRALLYTARLAQITRIRNPTLKHLLTEIIIEVEKHTLRGRALYYGLLIAMNRIRILGARILRDLTALLYLGISYINESPIYQNLNPPP